MLHDEPFYNIKDQQDYIKHRRNPLRGRPGCYYVLHLNSKFIYIGSTQSLGDRIHKTMSSLKCNRHKNINLQKLYNENNKIELFVQPTKSIEDAQKLEQDLVTKYKDSGFLCNIAIDNVLLTRFNRPLSEEHKQKLLLANINRIFTDDIRKKMSDSQKKFYKTKKGQLLIKKKSKKLSRKININNKDYNSISEASRKLNIPYTSLVRKYGIQPRRRDK